MCLYLGRETDTARGREESHHKGENKAGSGTGEPKGKNDQGEVTPSGNDCRHESFRRSKQLDRGKKQSVPSRVLLQGARKKGRRELVSKKHGLTHIKGGSVAGGDKEGT